MTQWTAKWIGRLITEIPALKALIMTRWTWLSRTWMKYQLQKETFDYLSIYCLDFEPCPTEITDRTLTKMKIIVPMPFCMILRINRRKIRHIQHCHQPWNKLKIISCGIMNQEKLLPRTGTHQKNRSCPIDMDKFGNLSTDLQGRFSN